jgi:predicted NAD/FAD-binding protein
MDIAIIGSGISGLGAAYLLNQQHNITLYEKNHSLGGHSRTIEVEVPEGKIPVDTGFIVFNYRNYPNLTGLFEQLDVPVMESDMSFGASIEDGWFEYGTQHLSNIFTQKRNILRPQFWKMVADILRFNKQAHRYIESDPSVTLGQCLRELKMGDWFTRYFLLAMGGSIWSTPLERMLEFPAQSFIRFFDNHGLLTVNDQPQWFTVKGGSREYVKRVSAGFQDKIKLNCGVKQVVRQAEKVAVTDEKGETALYDQAIFACHSDQALALLAEPTQKESELLAKAKYQPNEVVVHADESFMPRRKGAWASWVYLSESREDNNPAVCLSYWMNRLQSLPTQTPVIVTLNSERQPREDLVFDRHRFEHPVFDEGALRTQKRMEEIQGKDRIWFCGAWQRYGFHEDGLWSAVRVAEAMGVKIPWK